MYDLVVYILRGQPFTIAHRHAITQASKQAKKTLVILGSINSPRTIKNPFTFNERYEMVKDSLDIQYLQISGVVDYTYDSARWINAVTKIVSATCPKGRVALAGHKKDNSSSYLDHFPQYFSISVPKYQHYGDRVDATSVRNLYFEDKLGYLENYVPENVFDFLIKFRQSKEYKYLQEEYNFNKQHKKEWETPFPSIFVTVDALVYQSGSILLIKRKNNPGKGLWAMPGGYINVKETILESTLRELKEETQIKLQPEVLERNIIEAKIFDNPERSLRGRIITHVSLIKLDDTKPLPKVTGADDAEEAKWVPVGDFFNMRKEMFSDHFHIIESMI